ncbi:Protein of unknown function [Pyronema omphalodes CBS 100304]|uniref:Uncharacterized protein n=1 Tax=Pyronema omphalodes (strain CBS 100304) TaxID=1076935 RepID=U4L7E0_PYROM|nr:Protein of unknown function [Pyronema omphalodes CBS 100304]
MPKRCQPHYPCAPHLSSIKHSVAVPSLSPFRAKLSHATCSTELTGYPSSCRTSHRTPTKVDHERQTLSFYTPLGIIPFSTHLNNEKLSFKLAILLHSHSKQS